MKVTIERTQEDIERAIAEERTHNGLGMSSYCPLAQAIKRHFGVTSVGVGLTFGHFVRDGEPVSFEVGDEANTTSYRIEEWRTKVKPGTFTLEYEENEEFTPFKRVGDGR
jgi:hypothetical protein